MHISFLAVLLLLFITVCPVIAADQTVITLDGNSPGKVFEGIGALSAGASSRLLLNYPEPQRSDILDLLFKPKFGASLHHLKVEIGGDVNSTDGSEPSIAASRAEFDNPKPEYFTRGYEWWLMEEARKRNPNIILETLQWGAPGWIGEGKFYSKDNADFVAAFIKGAQRYHGLSVNYTGIRNEVRYDAGWVKLLRKTLDENGLSGVKIVAADLWHPEEQWEIAEDMARDPELKDAVSVLNAHVTQMVNHYVPRYARELNKPLWDGEAHAYGGDWYAAASHARLNRAYLLGGITKIISWSLITAYHDFLAVPNSGMMKANTPWSGHYEIQPPLWVIAHTNQFAEPGWRYLDKSCRFFQEADGGIREGWSVTALKAPDSGDYSLVIETMDAKEPQNVRFKLTGRLSQKDLAVYRTVWKQELFRRLDDIPVHDGEFSLTLVPNAVYSLTTTRGQQKGEPAHAIPKAAAFPLPFTADFEQTQLHQPGKYFCDQYGTFEVVPRPDGSGRCLKQIMTHPGINWCGGYSLPFTIVGDIGWKDYRLSAEVMLPAGGMARIWGRANHFVGPFRGYEFEIKEDGAWKLGCAGSAAALASGKTKPLGGTWHTVQMGFVKDHLTVELDKQRLADVHDASIAAGLAGLGTGWNEAYFDNVRITPP